MLDRLGLGIQLNMQETITSKSKSIVSAFDDIQNSAERMVNNVDKSMQRFQNLVIGGLGLNKVGNELKSFGNSIINTFINAGKQIMNIGSIYEDFRRTLKALYKDGEKANEVLEWAIKLGKTTPFETIDVIQSVIGLKGIGADAQKRYKSINGEMKQLIEYVGDLAGLRPDRGIDSARLAVMNAIMGRTRMLRLTYGLDPEQILGREIDRSSIDKTVQDIVTIISSRADGLMKSLEGTWRQILSNLEDYKADFLRGIAEGGFFEKVKSTLVYLQDTLNNINFKEVGKTLSDIFSMLYKPLDLFARTLININKGLLDFTKKYPTLSKIFGLFVGGIGIVSVLAGTFLKLAGNTIIVVANIGMLIAQMQLLKVAGVGVNNTLFKTIGLLKSFTKFSLIAVSSAGLLFYAYERNLFNLQQRFNDFMDSIENNPTLNRLKLIGRVLYNLFAEDTGTKVFFSEELVNSLKKAGLWDLTIQLVVLKGRIESLLTGIVTGIKEVIKSGVEIINAFISPLRKSLDPILPSFSKFTDLLKSINKNDLNSFKNLGKVIGKIAGILLSTKLIKYTLLFSKGVTSFTLGLIKVNKLKLLGLSTILLLFKKYIDSGGSIEDITNKINYSMYRLKEIFSPLADITQNFFDNISKYGLLGAFSRALDDLANWYNNGGREKLAKLMQDIINFITQKISDFNKAVDVWWNNGGKEKFTEISNKIGVLFGKTLMSLTVKMPDIETGEITNRSIWFKIGYDMAKAFVEGFKEAFNSSEFGKNMASSVKNIASNKGIFGKAFEFISSFSIGKLFGFKKGAISYGVQQNKYLTDDEINWRDYSAVATDVYLAVKLSKWFSKLKEGKINTPIDFMKKSMDFFKNSNVWASIRNWFTRGRTVVDEMQSTFNSQNMTNIWVSIRDFFSNFGDKIGLAVTGMFQTIKGFIPSIPLVGATLASLLGITAVKGYRDYKFISENKKTFEEAINKNHEAIFVQEETPIIDRILGLGTADKTRSKVIDLDEYKKSVEGLNLEIKPMEEVKPKKKWYNPFTWFSHKTGLDEVPYDGYRAELHKGEAVLNREEARVWREQKKVINLDSKRPVNNNIDNSIRIDKIEIIVQANNLSRDDARQQALMILEELEKLREENNIRRYKDNIM
ncbi:MAG: hypothetical protein H0Z24_05925 [Thermosipho sp. (in: Bacteria)]|nr:hypothetical protein [Thermosipho sp. (in: thermotogales)]